MPMKKLILGLTVVSLASSTMFAQSDFDDIYYNPNSKPKTEGSAKGKMDNHSSSSNYISDFSEMDVDAYNKRGFYYETEIDTIGASAEAAEDFVYTQQIQKYYNPTIVLDNTDILSDILENSYGNVNIEIKNNVPVFSSIYYGDYAWAPGYYNWTMRPSWSWCYSWSPFYPSFGIVPSWTWPYYPSWTVVYPWTWGYGFNWWYASGWGYRPWYPPFRPSPDRPMYAHNRPGAFRPTSPGSGWSKGNRTTSRHPQVLYGNNRNPNSGVLQSNNSVGNKRTDRNKINANSRPINGNGLSVTNSTISDKRGQVHASQENKLNDGHNINQTSISSSETTTVTRNRVNSSRAEKNSTNAGIVTTQSTNRNDRVTSTRQNNSNNYDRSNSSTYYNRSNNNSGSYNSGSSNRSYNSGSSNRSYNSGRSYSSGGSRSSGGASRSGGSHGGGRGGRR